MYIGPLCQQNAGRKRDPDHAEGESAAPPRKMARTDSQELNNDAT